MKRILDLLAPCRVAIFTSILLFTMSVRAEAFHIEYGPQWTYGANQSPPRAGLGLANDTPCTEIPQLYYGTRLSFTGASGNILSSQSQVFDHCLSLDLSSFAQVSSRNTLTIVRDACDPQVNTVRVRLVGSLTGQLSIESGVTVGCGGVAEVAASARVGDLYLPGLNPQLTAGPQQSLVKNISETWDVVGDCPVGVPLEIFGVLTTATSSQLVAEADAIANPGFSFSAQILTPSGVCPGASGVPTTSAVGKGWLIFLLAVAGVAAIGILSHKKLIE